MPNHALGTARRQSRIATTNPQLERDFVGYLLRWPGPAQRRARSFDPRNLSGPDEREIFLAILRATDTAERASQKDVVDALHATDPRRARELAQLVRDLAVAERSPHFDSDAAASVLTDLGERRRLREELLRAAALVDNGDLEAARAHVAGLAASIDDTADGPFRIANGRQLVVKLFEEVYARFQKTSVDLGPLACLARHLGSGDMLTIGGETGAGKSSAALWLARRWHVAHASPMGVVSLEDRHHTWGDRYQAEHSGVALLSTPQSLMGAALEEADRELREGRIPADGLLVAELTRTDLASVISAMRALVAQGATCLCVDYIQEVRVDPRVKRNEGIADAARAIKSVAKSLKVPLVLCSQLARPTSGAKREPTVSSLKESGDLENMSEAVVLLWRDSDAQDAPAFLKVAKLKSDSVRPRLRLVRGKAGVVEGFEELRDPALDDGPTVRPLRYSR